MKRWQLPREAITKSSWSSGEVGQTRMLYGFWEQSSRGLHETYLQSSTTTNNSRRVTRRSRVFPTWGELMRTSSVPAHADSLVRAEDIATSSSEARWRYRASYISFHDRGHFYYFLYFFSLSLFLFFEDPMWFYQSPGVVCFSFDLILSPFVVVLVMT